MEEVKELIASGKIREAISGLLEIFKDSKYEKDAYQISGQFEKLERDKNKGIIDDKDYDLKLNQIMDRVLGMVSFDPKSEEAFSQKQRKPLLWMFVALIGISAATWFTFRWMRQETPDPQQKFSYLLTFLDKDSKEKVQLSEAKPTICLILDHDSIKEEIQDGVAYIELDKEETINVADMLLKNAGDYRIDLEDSGRVVRPGKTTIWLSKAYKPREVKTSAFQTIRGRIIDGLGRPVSNARITYSEGARAVVSNDEGRFSFRLKKSADYVRVYVEKNGYHTWNDYVDLPMKESLIVPLSTKNP